MKRRTILFLVAAIILLAVGGFFILNKKQSGSSTSFQTAPITLGDLTAFVGATGTVRANQSAIMTWQTSGQIETVAIQRDQAVQAAQVLANLKESSLSQSVILARADLVTAQRNLDDLKISTVARANAQLNMVNAQKALDDALEKRESKQYKRSSQETLDIARANLIISEDQVTQKQRLYDQFDSLSQDDPMRAEAFSQLASAKQTRDRALANVNWLLGRPDAQELAMADANVEVARANLASAEREWNRLKNGPDPQDVSAAEAHVAALQATVELAQLKAPFAGTVTDVSAMAGDQITPGTAAFRVDDLSRLLVDVAIPEVDINRVRSGLPAKVTFDAIQGKEYLGRVTEVSRVGVSVQGVVNFTVTVELLDADQVVLPGMTAAVNIVVDQLEGVLLVPNRAVRLVNGQRTIYLLKNGKQTPVQIEIGATSDAYSEIVSGDVQKDDLVILNPFIAPETSGPPFAR